MEYIEKVLTLESIVFGSLALALVLGVARLLIGPDSADRVVALDMIAVTVVAMAVAHTITTDEPAILDAAIVVALTAFIGTVAFARYLERRAHDQ
jgi:multicomponent Na+:H+ antiporter subunit F